MPYFRWKGVDLEGGICSGKFFARSVPDLELQLLKREVALIDYKEVKPIWTLRSPVTAPVIISCMQQLSVLLASGVQIIEALTIIHDQIEHTRFQQILQGVIADISEGNTLDHALSNYTTVFSPMVIEMVRVGYKSGNLSQSLHQISMYLEVVEHFGKQVKSTLFVPGITLAFFIVISLVIFIGIIPQFESMFLSVHKQLPYITKILVNISNYMRSISFVIVLGISILLVGILKAYALTISGRRLIDRIVLVIPIVNTIIIYSSIVYFLRALTMLLRGGIHMVPALEIAQEAVNNVIIKEQLGAITQDVSSGIPLSKALNSQENKLFGHDIIALVRVGQESGDLIPMIEQACSIYRDKVQRQLSFITKTLHPAMMIFLGVLITGLIFAVYLPIFQLANIIS